MAENFLKSSPKCLLACGSSGTRGKIQNWVFFWPKSVKKRPFFFPKIQFFFKVVDLLLQFLSLVLAENFLKSSPKCILACVSSSFRWKIRNWGFFGQKVSKMAIFAKNPIF